MAGSINYNVSIICKNELGLSPSFHSKTVSHNWFCVLLLKPNYVVLASEKDFLLHNGVLIFIIRLLISNRDPLVYVANRK